MGDYQGRLGKRALRGPDHSGETAQAKGVDLQHGPHADGSHGRQRPAHRGESAQPDALSFRRIPPAGAARRTALRAQTRLQRRAHADGSVSARNQRPLRGRTRRTGSPDQGEEAEEKMTEGGETPGRIESDTAIRMGPLDSRTNK